MIGAGIVGASVAYHLSRKGVAVTVLDAGDEAPATAAGAGILTPVSTRPRSLEAYEFSFAAVQHYVGLIAELESLGHHDHGYAATGELIVASDPGELERLPVIADDIAELTDRHGAEGLGRVELLGRRAVHLLCPLLGDLVEAAIWLPRVARVDGRLLRERLDVAVDRGATVQRQRARLRVDSGRVVGVTTPAGPIEADVAVIAAGAWAGSLAADVGVDLAVQPQRGQIVHAQLTGTTDMPVVTGFGTHYLLSFPDDRIVFGATRENDSGFDPTVTVGGVAEVLREGMHLVPALARARLIETRVGLRPMSRDGEPYLGAVPGVAGLFAGAGMGPQGLTIGPYAGAILAELVTGNDVAVPGRFRIGRT